MTGTDTGARVDGSGIACIGLYRLVAAEYKRDPPPAFFSLSIHLLNFMRSPLKKKIGFYFFLRERMDQSRSG